MAFSRNYLYDPYDQVTSGFARALSHSARLLILRQLYNHGPLCVQELAESHPISDEAISQHLKILRTDQLVDWYERCPLLFIPLIKNMKDASEHIAEFLNFFRQG